MRVSAYDGSNGRPTAYRTAALPARASVSDSID